MRIKGVKPITVRKRGKVYRYFRHRRTGAVLKSEFGTPAFVAEIQLLDNRAEAKADPLPGELGALIAAYKTSPEFTELALRTRTDYERVFDYLAPLAREAVHGIDKAFIYGVRDKAYKKHRRRFANYVVQVFRLLLEWAQPRLKLDANEGKGVKTIRRPKGMRRANRAWKDSEREAVLSAAPIEIRAVVALGMFAGLREGDACRLLKTGYDGKVIDAVASKNGEELWIPAHFRLRAILAEAACVRAERQAHRARKRRVVRIDPPTLAVNSRGQSWTENGFRASFFKLLKRLERAGKVGVGLTFHGLRHTVGSLVIEAGGTTKDVAMILGDRSEAMGELYSRDVQKKKLNAATVKRMERIERKKMDKQADNFSACSTETPSKSLK